MNIEIQIQPDGTLRFVVGGKGTIATLSHLQLSLLYGIARMSRRHVPLQVARLEELGPARAAVRITAHLKAYKTTIGQLPAANVLADVEHLQKLNLITTSPRRQTLGVTLLWPHAPVQLTKEGRRLIDWLVDEWPGWTAYTQRFPL